MENKPSVLTDKYEVGRLLGQGTFAKVYYGRSVHTNQSVAIKMIDKEKVIKLGLNNQIKREISVMRIAKHPNVVELYEVMATKTRIYFVMEYCKGGELFNKLTKGKLRDDVAWNYFYQLINAVDFCHSRGVYHRDIKPENLLLDEDDNLKVSDFGLSALADCKRQDGLLHTTCGTPAYVAPEVINRKGYDGTKADVWSCGVVLFVLLAGYLPFRDSNLMEMYRKIGRGEFKSPSWFAPEVKRLLCLICQDIFGDVYGKRESRFTSKKPASVIISKMEEAAQRLKLRIRKREAGLLKLERLKEGRKGVVSMDAEIFQVTPTFHMVEVKKCNGDTLEYQKLVKEDLRPALADIVWVWQSDKDEGLVSGSQQETEQQQEEESL